MRRSQRLIKASDALVIPGGRPEAAARAVRRRRAQARAGHRRRRRPARSGGADTARHSGRQCRRRQQQRGGRICGHRGLDAAAALRLGGSPRSRPGNYAKFRARMMADNLAGIEGLQVGLVGFGTIGLAVAQAFHPHGREGLLLRSGASDAARPRRSAPGRCRSMNCWRPSDVVSLHVPLLPATRNLIGAAELARMKPGAVLIQALARRHRRRGGARGAASPSGHLGGAAVDVYSDRAAGARQSAAERSPGRPRRGCC